MSTSSDIAQGSRDVRAHYPDVPREQPVAALQEVEELLEAAV